MSSQLAFSPVELIAKKRDGKVLTSEEIEFFVIAFNNGDIPDYQMSAMLMAIYLRGMTDKETADLTLAFCKSGKIADLSSIAGPKVDKHSTGGVGDKISLILAPLAASCGLVVPMMTGRGLGHTGGTLDKLESIPGFKSNLTTVEFVAQLGKIGVAMIGPTADVAPVDKKIYALRDVTSTVGSLPLIVSSIMSKKICEGPSYILLDVKTGRGSFITEWETSVKLAKSMIAAGEKNGLPTVCLMTDMNQPLGKAVGNWFEMHEAILVLSGKGPSDVIELIIAQCAQMLILGGKVSSLKEGMQLAQTNLENGKGLAKLKEMIISQGGDAKYIDDLDLYPKSKYHTEIKSELKGYISEIDPLEIGWSSVMLGGGRQKIEDSIDYTSGILFQKKLGDTVEVGEIMAVAFTEKENHTSAVDRIHKAFTISKDPVEPNPIISHIITKDYIKEWNVYLEEQNCKAQKRKTTGTTSDVLVTAKKSRNE